MKFRIFFKFNRFEILTFVETTITNLIDMSTAEGDEYMTIISINPSLAGRFSQLRAGDRILWINKEPIITASTDNAHKRFERLKFLLSQTRFDTRFDDKIQLLIVRNDLEIFLKM